MPAPFPNKIIDYDEAAKADKRTIFFVFIFGVILLVFFLYLQDVETTRIHKLPKIPIDECQAYWEKLFIENEGSTSGLIEMSKKFSWQCSEFLEKNK